MTLHQERSPRSFACNGRLVRSLREKNGLRQVDLAEIAGYSVRLIGKAEAGKSLSKATIEILAEALSSVGSRIAPHQLILNLTSVGLEYLRARYSSDPNAVSQAADLLDKNFELRVFCGKSTLDFLPEYREHAGLVEYYQKFFAIFEPLHFDDPAESGDRLFEGADELLVWSDNVWQPRSVHTSEFPVSIASRLVFRSGLIIKHEERISIAAESDEPTKFELKSLDTDRVIFTN